MKLNDKRTTSIFKKSIANLPTFDFSGSEDIIFPFEVKTGFVNATEKGFVYDANVNDYSRFERIFTGFEAISAIWENSTSTLVDKTTTIKKLRKNYQPGNAFLGHYDNEMNQDSFTSMQEDTDFLKERVVSTATYYLKNKITQNDILKLFVIPNKFGKTIFYIDSVTEYTEPSTQAFKYAKVTFVSLNDKIANTGLAIDQYVQFSAPGEGYAYPKIVPYIRDRDRLEFSNNNLVFDNVQSIPSNTLVDNGQYLIRNFNNYGETIVTYIASTSSYHVESNTNGYVLDEQMLKNNPIVSAQLEVYAPGVLSSIYAFGRPIKENINSNNEEITIPRVLFASEITEADLEQRDITKPFSKNTSFYWIPRSRMEIESFYKDWTEKVKGDWNPSVTKKWLGYLRIIAKDYKSAQPNLAWRIFTDVFSLGLEEIAYNQPDVNIPGTGYWEIKGVQTLPKLLTQGYFTHRQTPRLPLDYKESIPWTLKNIPLVGGMLSKATFGLPIGWKNQTDKGGKNYNITGMISSGLLDFYRNTFIGTKTETLSSTILGSNRQDYTALPFDGFSDEAQPSAVSPGEFATILKFNLTDKFRLSSIDPNVYGNENDHSKAPIQPTKPLIAGGDLFGTEELNFNENVKWNADSIPVDKAITTDGYAIDEFGFHFLGIGSYKLSFFDVDNNVIFTGTYKTLSKLTESIRDWNNNIKLSHWESEESIDTRTELAPAAISLPTNTEPAENGMKNGFLYPVPLTEKDPDNPGEDIIQRDVFGNTLSEIDSEGRPIVKTVASLSDLTGPAASAEYVATSTASESIYLSDGHKKWMSNDGSHGPGTANISEWIPKSVVIGKVARGFSKVEINWRVDNLRLEITGGNDETPKITSYAGQSTGFATSSGIMFINKDTEMVPFISDKIIDSYFLGGETFKMDFSGSDTIAVTGKSEGGKTIAAQVTVNYVRFYK